MHWLRWLVTWLVLLVLLGAAVGVAWLPVSGAVGLMLALGIAALKGGIIVWSFMHVSERTPLVRFFAIAPLAWLVLLVGLTLSDVLTRPQMPAWITDPVAAPSP